MSHCKPDAYKPKNPFGNNNNNINILRIHMARTCRKEHRMYIAYTQYRIGFLRLRRNSLFSHKGLLGKGVLNNIGVPFNLASLFSHLPHTEMLNVIVPLLFADCQAQTCQNNTNPKSSTA